MVGAPHPELPGVGELIADKYEVERVLGAGGMGVVVAVRHVALGHSVALKLLSPQALKSPQAKERFLREARLAVVLKSEHVARVLDVGVLDSGAPFIVMEHLQGSDLRALTDERGPLDAATAVHYVLQAAEAIAEAHSLGVVHRDLKPANLFLTRRADGSPLIKVLDFGISKTLGASRSSDASLTSTDAVMGSPAYMAPEQIRSSKNVDHRVDIWALGIVLYELLSGAPPFDGDNIATLSAQICMDPIVPLAERRADLGSALSDVVGKCLEKDPDRRYADVGELARALLPFAPDTDRVLVERIGRLCRSIALDDTLPQGSSAPALGDTVRATAKTVGQSSHASSLRNVLLLALGVLGVAAVTAFVVQRPSESERPPAPSAAAPAAAPVSSESAPESAPPVASEAPPPASEAPPPASASAAPRDAATRPRRATRPARPAASAPRCPVGLVWRGSSCERPLATSF